MQWFKFYGSDWLHDMKIITMLPIDQLVFVYLLSMSSISEIPGTLKRCKEDILLKMFHLDSEVSAFGCIRRLEEVGIINVTACHEIGYFDIDVKNFRKRQERALTASERQAIYRDKKKTNSNEKVTGSLRIITDVTKRNKTVTLEESRGEERRVEKKREEKKIHSDFENIKKTLNKFTNGQFDDFEEQIKRYSSEWKKTPQDVKKELKKFGNYWLEENVKGTRVENVKGGYFEIKRRLTVWLSVAWGEKPKPEAIAQAKRSGYEPIDIKSILASKV